MNNATNNSAIVIPTEVAVSFMEAQRDIATALIKALSEGVNRIAASKEQMQAQQHAHELRLIEKKAELMK